MPELCNRGGEPREKKGAPIAGVATLVTSQRHFFRSGATRPLAQRIETLKRLDQALVTHEKPILEALANDLGKPPVEAWLAELRFLRDELRLAIRSLNRWARPTRPRPPFFFLPARNEVRHEPFGLSLIIAPWNYPIQLALSPAIAAIAAGNCVVIKPSELTPASSAALATLVRDTFDPAHISVIEGGPDLSQSLLAADFDLLFYTGNETVGRIVARAAANRLVPAVLELGGKCPVVIDRHVDLEQAARRITAGKFFNAGQTCFAPDFVAVPESALDELHQRIEQHILKNYGENRSPDLARIVNDRHYQRLLALATGDVTRIGEDAPPDRYLAPRLIRATWDHPAMEEEVFGPILPLVPYRDEAELLAKLASLPAPLALYLFSSDRSFQDRFTTTLRSGSVAVNDVNKQAIQAALPFGGVGASGIGRYRGEAGFKTFSYTRSITHRYLSPDPFHSAPPYGDLLKRLKKWIR